MATKATKKSSRGKAAKKESTKSKASRSSKKAAATTSSSNSAALLFIMIVMLFAVLVFFSTSCSSCSTEPDAPANAEVSSQPTTENAQVYFPPESQEETTTAEETTTIAEETTTTAEETTTTEAETTTTKTSKTTISDDTSNYKDVKNPNYKSKYYIIVYLKNQRVLVLGKDENGKYTENIKVFTCSSGKSGHATPTALTSITKRWRWRALFGNVYGQYTTKFNGNILFHSVPYTKESIDTLQMEEFNKLGKPASKGCIRLCVRDAKWIYDNAPNGTQVRVMNASCEFAPAYVPSLKSGEKYAGWDPTDPNSKNPYKSSSNDESDSTTQESTTTEAVSTTTETTTTTAATTTAATTAAQEQSADEAAQ